VFLRTIGPEPTQGDAPARFARASLGVRGVILIDDEPELGARMVDTRERDAAAAGAMVLIRWRLASAHDTSRNLTHNLTHNP
jgi:hypothetical protein